MGDRVSAEMTARMRMLNALLGDLQARLPGARRDIAWLIDDQGESELSVLERHEMHVDAVEAVLRRRFGGVVEVSDEFWREAAQECWCAAEVGI